jgi:RNA polymerase sigma-70 factor, ECF subfamily
VLGLRALLRYVDARRGARLSEQGAFIPLTEQDPTRWDAAAIDEAEALLHRCAQFGQPGAFQIEAAIQSVHAARRMSGPTRWPEIATLYRVLLDRWPSHGARVGAAVAFIECGELHAAADQLAQIPPERAQRYPAWWAARAHLCRAQGDLDAAAAALRCAAGLTLDPPVRAFLLARAAAG